MSKDNEEVKNLDDLKLIDFKDLFDSIKLNLGILLLTNTVYISTIFIHTDKFYTLLTIFIAIIFDINQFITIKKQIDNNIKWQKMKYDISVKKILVDEITEEIKLIRENKMI